MTTKKELEQEIIRLDLAFRKLADKRHVIDIIYPNIEKFAQWEELRYSIRSLEKNLRNIEFKIWIVGDWPQWLDPEKASHIPCEFTGKTPRIDILHKHLAVIRSEERRVG